MLLNCKLVNADEFKVSMEIQKEMTEVVEGLCEDDAGCCMMLGAVVEFKLRDVLVSYAIPLKISWPHVSIRRFTKQ